MLVADEHDYLDFRQTFSSWMIKKPLFFPLQSSAGPSAPHILYPRNAKLLQSSNCHLEHTFPCLSRRRLYSELVFRALSLLSFLNPPLGTAPRGSTNSMSSAAAASLFQGWTHLRHTQSKPSLPAEPHCAQKPRLGEELAFPLHCWRAKKHFFNTTPSQKPSAHACLHTHDGAWQRKRSPSSLKPRRISISNFQWTTDRVWKRLLSGGGVEVGHPMLGQNSENSVVLLNWSWHYLINGKYKTCGCSP